MQPRATTPVTPFRHSSVGGWGGPLAWHGERPWTWSRALVIAQEALATHPLCHRHSPTQAAWPSLPVAVIPVSELQAMPKAKPASPGLEPGPDV